MSRSRSSQTMRSRSSSARRTSKRSKRTSSRSSDFFEPDSAQWYKDKIQSLLQQITETENELPYEDRLQILHKQKTEIKNRLQKTENILPYEELQQTYKKLLAKILPPKIVTQMKVGVPCGHLVKDLMESVPEYAELAYRVCCRERKIKEDMDIFNAQRIIPNVSKLPRRSLKKTPVEPTSVELTPVEPTQDESSSGPSLTPELRLAKEAAKVIENRNKKTFLQKIQDLENKK